MEALKDEGCFLVLDSDDDLRRQLLKIERAGRTCYQSENKPITLESATKFVKMLIKSGHESVLEHSCITVRFSNLSRGFTHEQVRHRLTAISQESTRYVDYAKKGKGPNLDKFQIKFVVPPHRDENEQIPLEDGRIMTPSEMATEYEKYYRALRKVGWTPQDARQWLPIGIKSQIVVSANFREWRHIFHMRTSKPAHWEIRRVMCNLLEKLQGIIPGVFDDFVEAGHDQNGLRYFKKECFSGCNSP